MKLISILEKIHDKQNLEVANSRNPTIQDIYITNGTIINDLGKLAPKLVNCPTKLEYFITFDNLLTQYLINSEVLLAYLGKGDNDQDELLQIEKRLFEHICDIKNKYNLYSEFYDLISNSSLFELSSKLLESDTTDTMITRAFRYILSDKYDKLRREAEKDLGKPGVDVNKFYQMLQLAISTVDFEMAKNPLIGGGLHVRKQKGGANGKFGSFFAQYLLPKEIRFWVTYKTETESLERILEKYVISKSLNKRTMKSVQEIIEKNYVNSGFDNHHQKLIDAVEKECRCKVILLNKYPCISNYDQQIINNIVFDADYQDATIQITREYKTTNKDTGLINLLNSTQQDVMKKNRGREKAGIKSEGMINEQLINFEPFKNRCSGIPLFGAEGVIFMTNNPIADVNKFVVVLYIDDENFEIVTNFRGKTSFPKFSDVPNCVGIYEMLSTTTLKLSVLKDFNDAELMRKMDIIRDEETRKNEMNTKYMELIENFSAQKKMLGGGNSSDCITDETEELVENCVPEALMGFYTKNKLIPITDKFRENLIDITNEFYQYYLGYLLSYSDKLKIFPLYDPNSEFSPNRMFVSAYENLITSTCQEHKLGDSNYCLINFLSDLKDQYDVARDQIINYIALDKLQGAFKRA